MKLVRFGPSGQEKPGVLSDTNEILDCSAVFADWNGAFFAADGMVRLAAYIEANAASLPRVAAETRMGPPVARPGKVICIGLNYADHAKEIGQALPEYPVTFMKATSSICGPNDAVYLPRGSSKTDWEVELGLVIGKEARYLESVEQSAKHIAGWCMVNDVSEREFQKLLGGGQWTKGKSHDHFCPLGPWLLSADALADPLNLTMELKVNGEVMQQGSSATMIFDPFYLVHHLSQYMTLEPGDIISTGTPPGVGAGQKPPRYLCEGDALLLRIEGLGEQRNVCVRA